MKIIRDNYNPKKFPFPIKDTCKHCLSLLLVDRADVQCNKLNDIEICIEVIYTCPLCHKINWVQLPS